jgi:hypothetical protein
MDIRFPLIYHPFEMVPVDQFLFSHQNQVFSYENHSVPTYIHPARKITKPLGRNLKKEGKHFRVHIPPLVVAVCFNLASSLGCFRKYYILININSGQISTKEIK